jgi:RHS repeat-associated protein
LTSTPSGSYTYDDNGNTLTKPDGTQYSWDHDNRLTQVVLPGAGGTVTFKYDPFGRRAQKSFTQSSTTTTNYLYDGDNLLEEVDNSGNVLARYTQSPRIDQPLAELRSGATSYYEQDGVGSVTSLSNTAGALANTYTYDSFGKLTFSSGTVTNPFQYTAREFDAETSLYYYRARHYDQSVGRFVSEDPLQFDEGVNFYRYVGNNPLNWIDPTGLSDRDVQTIINTFNNVVSQMTNNGERSSPWTNNLQVSWDLVLRRKRRHLGCGEQAARVYPALDNNRYDDHWRFEWQERYFPLPHQWLLGISDNPNDPNVVVDPYNNDVHTVPK